MNIADIIVLIIIALCTAFALHRIIKRGKNGECIGCGSCTKCEHNKKCSNAKK